MDALAMIDVSKTEAINRIGPLVTAIRKHEGISPRLQDLEPDLNPLGPLLSIVIPAFNEEATIQKILNRVWLIPIAKQIIVVDDCSRDNTHEALCRWEHAGQITILRHKVNRGKGAAIRTGLKQAVGKFTVIQDADLEYDPRDIPSLIAPMMESSCIAVYGSRYLEDPIRFWRIRRLFELGVVLLNWGARLIYGVRLTDEATCYKVFPTAALRAMQLSCERFEFCPEVTAKACRLGITIRELPVSYHPRSADEGKKIKARDGWEALWTLWRYRTWCPHFV